MVCPTYPVQKCQELGSIISGHGGGSVLNLSRACKQEERREEDEVAVSHRFVPQSMWPNPVSVVLLHYTGRGKKITGQRCSLGRVIFKYYQNIVEIKNPVEQIVAVTHYRKTLIRRVPESLPCVFYRAHSKERIYRVPESLFVVCQSPAHGELKSSPCAICLAHSEDCVCRVPLSSTRRTRKKIHVFASKCFLHSPYFV